MSRTTLPSNFVLDEGTILEAMEITTGWANGNTANGTMDLDTTNKLSGRAASLRVTVTNPGQLVRLTKSISFKRNGQSFWDLWVYSNYTSATHEFTIILSSNGAMTITKQATFMGIMVGWNRFRVHFDNMTSTGGATWNDTYTYLRLSTYPEASTTPTYSFNNLSHSVEQIPTVMITFDDYYESVYSEAYNYMKNKGIKGTFYVITSQVGNSGKVSLEELTEMHNAGWTIANHTYDHTVLTTLEEEGVVEEYNLAKEWLIENGFSDGAEHIAYPGGRFNQTVLDAMDSVNALTGRTIQFKYNAGPPENLHLLRSGTVGNTSTLSTVKSYIDYAVKNMTNCNLLFHNLVDTPTTISEWGISDFQDLIDYIQAKKIRCVTVNEWYKGLTNPRYIFSD